MSIFETVYLSYELRNRITRATRKPLRISCLAVLSGNSKDQDGQIKLLESFTYYLIKFSSHFSVSQA